METGKASLREHARALASSNQVRVLALASASATVRSKVRRTVWAHVPAQAPGRWSAQCCCLSW